MARIFSHRIANARLELMILLAIDGPTDSGLDDV